jgi:putative ABC transport system permease protein
MFLVRIAPNTDIEQMKEFISTSVKEFDPNADEPKIRFYRDDFQHFYESTRRQAVLLSIFAVLSVIISLMGVFGIVLFEMQHRRREIAIRRVFGATTVGMLWMLNRRYASIVAICFVVAAPVAWYIVGEWQKDFAHRAPIGWWVYLMALMLVLGITIGLVTQRCWKAANENPADVVKSE